MWMGVFMLVGEMALEIRLLAKRGKGLRAIAREVGVSRNTVRRYLRDGDTDRYHPRPRPSGQAGCPGPYPSGEPHLPFQVKPLSSVLMDDLKVAHKYGGG